MLPAVPRRIHKETNRRPSVLPILHSTAACASGMHALAPLVGCLGRGSVTSMRPARAAGHESSRCRQVAAMHDALFSLPSDEERPLRRHCRKARHDPRARHTITSMSRGVPSLEANHCSLSLRGCPFPHVARSRVGRPASARALRWGRPSAQRAFTGLSRLRRSPAPVRWCCCPVCRSGPRCEACRRRRSSAAPRAAASGSAGTAPAPAVTSSS